MAKAPKAKPSGDKPKATSPTETVEKAKARSATSLTAPVPPKGRVLGTKTKTGKGRKKDRLEPSKRELTKRSRHKTAADFLEVAARQMLGDTEPSRLNRVRQSEILVHTAEVRKHKARQRRAQRKINDMRHEVELLIVMGRGREATALAEKLKGKQALLAEVSQRVQRAQEVPL